jgi:hypothetical protein
LCKASFSFSLGLGVKPISYCCFRQAAIVYGLLVPFLASAIQEVKLVNLRKLDIALVLIARQ